MLAMTVFVGLNLVSSVRSSLFQDGQANESALREAFAKEFKDKDPAKRVEALRKLGALSNEKTLLVLAGALRDPEPRVRKATAEVISSCTDVAGAAVQGLCTSLLNKKEDKEVRTACAKALARAQVKAEAIDALVQAISGITEQEKDLFQFGADCTQSLNWLGAQDFGAGKETPDKWKRWWAENKAGIVKEDQEKLAAHRKATAGKGK
jgi:HEAT repeat protein